MLRMIAFNRQFPFRMSAKKVSPLSPKKTSSRSIKKGDANAINESTKKRKMDPPPFIEPPMLLVKLLSEHGVAPKRETASAAGYDIVSAYDCTIPAKGRHLVQTDVALALPEGTYGRIAPRSGLAVKSGIGVGGGVIDADYRGPIGVLLFNHSDEAFEVKRGDRVAQLVIEVISTPEVKVVEELSKTERGEGGFGSTGVATKPTDAVENE